MVLFADGESLTKWVMSHIWFTHVTDMNESYHTPGTRRRWREYDHISHVSHMIQSWHRYDWVMSHTWYSSPLGRINSYESCLTYNSIMYIYDWVMSHTWYSSPLGRVRSYESCLTYDVVMSQKCMSHVTHMMQSCHIYESCHTYESCRTCDVVMS